jgi:transcriptional regulator with XRE-family HTH domain
MNNQDEWLDPEEAERAEHEAFMAANEAKEELDQFTDLLLSNRLAAPNDFTIKMGELIRKARESMSMSQADLAKKLGRRQATISEIENGKSEIGIFTLVAFAVVLQKPILYFFPESMLKSYIADVKSTFEYDVVDIAREIEEHQGDKELTLELLKFLNDKFEREFYAAMEQDPNEP